jgi:hypothetical protein
MTTPDPPREDTPRLDPVTDPAAPAGRDDSLATEVFDEGTRALPAGPAAAPHREDGTTWAPAPAAAPTATATADRPATHPSSGTAPVPPAREYVKGPAPFAVVLGLLGLVVAAATLVTEVVGIDVPWDDLGPWSVVGAGVLVLLVGGLGLRASRSQD